MKKSFRNPSTGILKASGFTQTNDPGDISQDEDETFNLEPGQWQWDGKKWNPYVPPLSTIEQEKLNLLQSDMVVLLKSMSQSEIRTWITFNINNLSEAKSLLIALTSIVNLLLKKL